jgi:hypothetical protein
MGVARTPNASIQARKLLGTSLQQRARLAARICPGTGPGANCRPLRHYYRRTLPGMALARGRAVSDAAAPPNLPAPRSKGLSHHTIRHQCACRVAHPASVLGPDRSDWAKATACAPGCVWAAYMERYCRAHRPSRPWWYARRPSIARYRSAPRILNRRRVDFATPTPALIAALMLFFHIRARQALAYAI